MPHSNHAALVSSYHKYAGNISFISSSLGQRILQLEKIIRNGQANMHEIAQDYEDTVSAIRQVNAVQKIFDNPMSCTGMVDSIDCI